MNEEKQKILDKINYLIEKRKMELLKKIPDLNNFNKIKLKGINDEYIISDKQLFHTY